MSPMSRRALIASGGVAAATLPVACSSSPADPATAVAPATGVAVGPDHADTAQPHVFDLAGTGPRDYPGGQLRHANEETFPILAGQDVSAVLVRVLPGGVREPHWHPYAWELHYVLTGSARFSLVEAQAYQEQFEVGAGQLVFLPQGGLHYFENTSTTEDYTALLVFNTSVDEPRDDIGLVAALGVIPRDVLGLVFGVDPRVFAAVPQRVEPVVLARRP